MPIVDYKKKAERAMLWFFRKENISTTNKVYLKKFMDGYNRSYARIDIFLTHIHRLLSKTSDIKADMFDRDKINSIFIELRKEFPRNYGTIVNVSNVLVKWLNDGDKPKGFKDIKCLKKDKRKRDLNPNDMITWEDGLSLINATNSLQFKTILATQLDGGFRPSEFVDLNYDDAQIKKEFIIINVKRGKTGKRNVILMRCVPYLLRWLHSHPTKKKGEPLWVKENSRNKKIERYDYFAIQKRIKFLAMNLNFGKPVDFYNFRHSAVYLSKMDNIPEEIAAEKFGHSIQYYTETYGRLSSDDKIMRLSRHYGLMHEEPKEIKKNKLCFRCEFSNIPDAVSCERCGTSLSIKEIIESTKEKEQLKFQLESMKGDFEKYKEELKNSLFEDIKKDIMKQIKSKIEA